MSAEASDPPVKHWKVLERAHPCDCRLSRSHYGTFTLGRYIRVFEGLASYDLKRHFPMPPPSPLLRHEVHEIEKWQRDRKAYEAMCRECGIEPHDWTV